MNTDTWALILICVSDLLIPLFKRRDGFHQMPPEAEVLRVAYQALRDLSTVTPPALFSLRPDWPPCFHWPTWVILLITHWLLFLLGTVFSQIPTSFIHFLATLESCSSIGLLMMPFLNHPSKNGKWLPTTALQISYSMFKLTVHFLYGNPPCRQWTSPWYLLFTSCLILLCDIWTKILFLFVFIFH